MAEFVIRSMAPEDVSTIIDMSMRAWAPVFERLKSAVPAYVYDAFYPDGWQARQTQDIKQNLEKEGDNVFVGTHDGKVVGFVGVRIHPEDQMGEIYIVAVDPDYQRQGLATALIEFAMAKFQDAGLKIAMVETGDDPGHAPSRSTYERAGFERWPVARYFREV